MTVVKICGLSTADSVTAAVQAGARYLGFNFFEKSPRYVNIPQARELALLVPADICKVALAVDPTNELLDAITGDVPIDMLQLHGAETPERVLEIKARYGLPVMKAVGVADAFDLAALDAYARVCDQILVDAKPPKNAELPGGNGLSFDWRLIAGRRWACPWMLAGGLNAKNVAEAVRLTGAKQVDVSSGVESAPGVKDNDRIAAFIAAAQGEQDAIRDV
jgi:phosphoribosylanthranilate isomerase